MEIFEIFGFWSQTKESIRFFSMSVSAGKPYNAESDIDEYVDLNEFLIEHPLATFFVKIRGDEMNAANIADGDILIVDTAIVPKNGKIVLARLNSLLTIKIFRDVDGEIFLETPDERFLPLKIEPYMEYEIIGVVTKVIHSLEI